jgi:predicted metal-dependent peptidase
MTKLIKKFFSELPKGQQKSIIEDFQQSFNPEYLTGRYSNNIVDAEIVVDENGCLYDIRVFDPYHKVSHQEGKSAIYINFDGWSGWLYDYRDPAGHDIDEIFDEYDGEVQE